MAANLCTDIGGEMMQTQIDLLVLTMMDNGMKEIGSGDPILAEVYDELEYQGRKPNETSLKWGKSMMGRLQHDNRFRLLYKQQEKCRGRKYKYRYRMFDDVEEPERDYVTEEDVLYVMRQYHKRDYDYVSVDLIAEEFDAKRKTVKALIVKLKSKDMVQFKSGSEGGYKIKEG